MIRKLKNSEIDLAAYMRCIENSIQKNFYTDPAVLGLLCESWELLVHGDYEYAMPVPTVRKFGFKFVSMPLFLQQLGVLGKDDDSEINQLFIDELLKSYAVQTYNFNDKNTLDGDITTRKNYIIPKQDYDELSRKGFSKGRKSVIKNISGLRVLTKDVGDETYQFIRTHFKGLNKQTEIQSFIEFLQKFSARLQFRHVYNNNILVSLAILTETEHSLGLLALINDEEFKALNASSFLINELLKENIAEKSLDFMGGNIRGIEVFFKSFGSVMTTYPVIQNGRSQVLKDIFKHNFLK